VALRVVVAAVVQAVRARQPAAGSMRWMTIFRSDLPHPKNVKINPAFERGFS
jgi:hypothetical protein